jgi:hypothetical protein
MEKLNCLGLSNVYDEEMSKAACARPMYQMSHVEAEISRRRSQAQQPEFWQPNGCWSHIRPMISHHHTGH